MTHIVNLNVPVNRAAIGSLDCPCDDVGIVGPEYVPAGSAAVGT